MAYLPFRVYDAAPHLVIECVNIFKFKGNDSYLRLENFPWDRSPPYQET